MIDLVGAGLVLVATVAAGTIAHELSHVAVLRWFGVDYAVAWFPDETEGDPFGIGVRTRWATVTPGECARPWVLRVAAMAPLALAVPLALVAAGVVSDPLSTGNVYRSAALVGTLACALPSPGDFQILWHAERALAERDRSTD